MNCSPALCRAAAAPSSAPAPTTTSSSYNWVCGNLSSAEGGGVAHLGFIYNGDIEHNTIALNQSTNPTIPTNGGGIHVMGTPDTDPVCGTQIDADCPPGLSDGTGPGLVINANLIQANTAESGSGGGIRLQQVNGTDVSTFPTTPTHWNSVSITNNIIVNNVAGWDGAGISLQDSLNVSIINNTIASNDTLASSGVLTQSIGTPEASAPAGNCVQPGPTGATSASCPQSAGVTSTQNSRADHVAHRVNDYLPVWTQPDCTGFSNPLLQNNVIWQNRSFYIGVGSPGYRDPEPAEPRLAVRRLHWDSRPGADRFRPMHLGRQLLGHRRPRRHGAEQSQFRFTLNPTYSVLDDRQATPAQPHNLGSNPSIRQPVLQRFARAANVHRGGWVRRTQWIWRTSGNCRRVDPESGLQPHSIRDGGRGQQLDQRQLGSARAERRFGDRRGDGNYGGGPLFANYAPGSPVRRPLPPLFPS